jgi:hypothetical protein
MDATSAALRARFWKSHLLLPQTPRKGDKAAVIADHHRTETGLLVKVRDDPIYSEVTCTECGGKLVDWCVEVQLLDELGREPPEGFYVFAYPVKWLQRVLPLRHEDASQKQIAVSAG